MKKKSIIGVTITAIIIIVFLAGVIFFGPNSGKVEE